jgi:hypothetical protein
VVPESGVNFAPDVLNMEDEAAEEEAKDKQLKAGLAKKALKRRLGSQDGTTSAPSGHQLEDPSQDGLQRSTSHEVETSPNEALGDDGVDREVGMRARASESWDRRIPA